MRRCARRHDGVGDPEPTEPVHRVRPQRDAGADLLQVRSALEHDDLASCPLERNRGGEAGDSSADHQNAIVHGARLWVPPPARVGDLPSPSRGGYDREVLFGREAESAAVEGLLAQAALSRSGALVVRGEPGVGKSALLHDAIEHASGMRVLRAGGVEAESELAFAALQQLLRPVLDRLPRLPEPQAAALAGALGLSRASVKDRFLIGVAVLNLLAEAADEEPLVCVIDDAQWLDRPSADALTFAGRRLEAEGVVLLLAARDGELRRFEGAALAELRLGGLAADAAGALLSHSVRSPVSPAVRDRLVESTGGNPLALIELPALLSEDQLAGRAALPDPLPQSAQIERVYLERASRLPAPAQQLLLLVAADDTGTLATILRASDALGIELDALEAAEEAGLVRAHDGVVEFRHPLARSTVYHDATFAQRQTVHRALAAAFDHEHDVDRRAWHRAAASLGHDEEVADELERTARRARHRSGFAAAARALERAAELSGSDEARGRRLVAAAQDAWLAGQPVEALALLDRARGRVSELSIRAEATHLRGTIELRCGDPSEAATTLAAGASEIASVAPAKAIEMLVEAAQAASYSGDVQQVVEFGRWAAALSRPDEPGQRFTVDVIVGIGSLLGGDTARAVPRLRRALAVAERFQDPRRLVHAGACAGYLGEETTEHELYGRAVAQARESGAVATLPYVLEYLARSEAVDGRYTSAGTHAAEGLRLARETGQQNAVCHLLASQALLAALQGREDECRADAQQALELATARGLGYHAALAEWALARLDLGLGRPAEALTRLTRLATAGPGSGHPFVKVVSAPELVEAAVRTNQPGTAQAALLEFERFARKTAPPWALALVARCRGLLSADQVAEGHFREALRRHGGSARPFDRARTEFVFGEFLRRAGHRTAAREHLRSALDAFERLRARSWAERARLELRASGETARKRSPSAIDQLTPQELQITRLVAEGATNKEVAARLFLSPRTIDYHLRKIFTKLGISSRTELMGSSLEGGGPRAGATAEPARA
jgi:DNA-binding CsgD family transcriptional regulator